MKTNYILLFALMLMVSLKSSAQIFSGRVIGENQLPVEYATVALLSVPDSALVGGTVTDSKGVFKITAQDAGPYYEQLKNAIHYGNRFTYLGGAPNLQPTYIHAAEMRAIYRDLQLSVGYNRYNDDILFSIEQITSDPKISLIKFRNVDHRDEMTASLVFAPSIGCWKPEWTASLNSQWFKIGYLNEIKNMNGTTFGVRWNNSFQLPAGYIFRLNGEYTGKGVYQNCYTRPVSCLSTSIYKSFFNGRVDCLLEGNDLFHSMRGANTQYDDRVKMFRETKRNTQEVKLTVHYKFNLQKSKYKGTGAGLGEQQRL